MPTPMPTPSIFGPTDCKQLPFMKDMPDVVSICPSGRHCYARSQITTCSSQAFCTACDTIVVCASHATCCALTNAQCYPDSIGCNANNFPGCLPPMNWTP